MKSKITSYSVVSFLFLLMVSFLLSSCESTRVGPEVGRPNPAAPVPVPLVLTGVVIDNSTGAPIAGATVLIQGTSMSVVSNGSGVFTFSDLSSLTATQVVLLVTAPNYGYSTGTATIDKTNNLSSVPTILMTKIVTSAPITVTAATGGSGSTVSTEAAGSNVVSITVPPSVVTQTTQVTIAALPTDATPPMVNYSTTNDLASVQVSPIEAVFNAPGASITFALPYQVAAGTLLPVSKLVK